MNVIRQISNVINHLTIRNGQAKKFRTLIKLQILQIIKWIKIYPYQGWFGLWKIQCFDRF